jgi:hypothetical protein
MGISTNAVVEAARAVKGLIRWCYHDEQSALEALEAWDGTNEPAGWHRHPATGRRFDENGVLQVYA